MAHLELDDATGNAVPLTYVDATAVSTLVAATSTSPKAPSITSEPVSLPFLLGSLIFDDTAFTDILDVSFADPNGCQPMLAFTLTKSGARSSHTGCFPGLHDHKMAGTISGSIGFAASLPTGATFGVETVLVASTDCASIDDPATLVTLATAVTNTPLTINVSISPPQSSGGGDAGGGSDTCPGGILVSTLECDPIGSGGQSSYCLTAAEYMQATGGLPLPATCAASGTTGCEGAAPAGGAVLIDPCCPGLTCRVTSTCGDSSGATGGTCLP